MISELRQNRAAVKALEAEIGASVSHLKDYRGDRLNPVHTITVQDYAVRGTGRSVEEAIANFLARSREAA